MQVYDEEINRMQH